MTEFLTNNKLHKVWNDLSKEIFICDYELGSGTKGNPFLIFFSSKTLMIQLKMQGELNNNKKYLGIDPTYKFTIT